MESNVKKVHVVRFPEGKDLMKEIKRYCEEKKIKSGMINVIGALKNATLGYFDTRVRKYIKKEIDEQCELISAMGNISTLKDETFIHVHALLGSKNFDTIGGHLIRGEIFVAEVTIIEFEGGIERTKVGDLYLWETE